MKVQLVRYHDLDNVNTRLAQSLNKRQGVLPPLGLAYVAGALEKAGHQVDIVDAQALALEKEDLRNRIREFNPDLVGVTAMTPTYRGAQEVALLAKEEGKKVIIGGVHMALFPRETLENDYFDYGVIGEGEESTVELCNALDAGESLAGIEGICYKENGQIHVGTPRIAMDLDALAWPSYHLLPMHLYSSIIGLHPTSTMMGSRGCPYKCGFCYKTPSDKKYRTRDPKNIVKEIQYLVENYGLKEVMFYDDIMPQNYAKALSEELLANNVKIKWQVPQRVNLVNKDMLKLMAKAGCHILRYGVEQGDPEMMQFVEKKTTIDQVRKVFKWSKEAGINSFAYFIIGYINETEKTMQATIDLAKELDPRFVMFTKAVPLPNTPLMYQSVEAGFIKADYWSRFTKGEKVEPIQPLVPNADQWVARAYRQFYIRPWYMVRQLFRIRSMNDLVKNVSGFIGILGFKMSEEERPLFFRYFGLNRLRNLTKLIFGRSNIKSIE